MLGFNKVFYCLKYAACFELFRIPLDCCDAIGSVTETALSVFSFLPQQTPVSRFSWELSILPRRR